MVDKVQYEDWFNPDGSVKTELTEAERNDPVFMANLARAFNGHTRKDIELHIWQPPTAS